MTTGNGSARRPRRAAESSTRPTRRALVTVVAVTMAVVLAACGSDDGTQEEVAPDQGDFLVAAYNFNESKVLANLYAQALEAYGVPASVLLLTNREIVVPALEAGEVDMIPEYAGTLTEFLNVSANGPDAPQVASNDIDETMAALEPLAAARDLSALEPAQAQDQNAFAVRGDLQDETGIVSLTEMAQWSQSNDVILGGPPECPQRPFCMKGLEDVYGMRIVEFRSLDTGPLTKKGLEQEIINLGLVLTSDGGVEQAGLVILEDDKGLQLSDNIVPFVRSEDGSGQIADTLNAVSAQLTTEELADMNYAVDVERRQPDEVAAQWLAAQGLA